METNDVIKNYLKNFGPEFVVRSILSKRSLTDSATNSKQPLEMFRIASGYFEEDFPRKSCEHEIEVCVQMIIEREDWTFINGNKDLKLLGLTDTPTIRNSLFEAIAEFKPKYILCDRTSMRLIKDIQNVQLVESQFVDFGVYYLTPEITNNIAEFVVSTELAESYPCETKDGRIFHEIGEWINIKLYKIEKFVKVTIAQSAQG